MNEAPQNILVINGGSSSIKFALYSPSPNLHTTFRGQIERIGMSGPMFSVQGSDHTETFTRQVDAHDHAAAIALLMDWISARQKSEDGGLTAVGHRIVHGGSKYVEPQRLAPPLLDELRQLTALAPAHLPHEIQLLETIQKRYLLLPQVVCFDTAFHRDLPDVARMLAIPRRYLDQGVRRYGFHGLSYQFLMSELNSIDRAEAAGRIVLIHLGNGVSLAAVRDGKSIDTSMGFTPMSGVMMGTRSGDVDPGLVGFFARTEGFDAKQFDVMVNSKSGLLGVSETSADMRELLAHEIEDHRAAEAIALFCYQIKKCIGSFAAALGGLDTLVFTGGMGEKSPVVRARICEGLGFLGIQLDATRNETNAAVISADAVLATIKVRVIAANEEIVIARAVCRIVGIPEG